MRAAGVVSLALSHTDNLAVVYPGIPHPSYGTQRELAALLQALRSRGVASLLDVDLSVSTASDWFDFDGTASQYAFGTLGDRLRGAPAGGDVSASVRGDNRV